MSTTETFYEFPCCDRDPVDRWSFGRATLLGDAAHPMYPTGSNGASQAILDALALAAHLMSGAPVARALAAYDAERRPATAAITLSNRRGGGRGDRPGRGAGTGGFTDLGAVASHAEREAVVRGYATLAGYAVDQVNQP
ncbi:MAG: FAD-dependent monooxygenase [Thermomicrobiales bacterium]